MLPGAATRRAVPVPCRADVSVLWADRSSLSLSPPRLPLPLQDFFSNAFSGFGAAKKE